MPKYRMHLLSPTGIPLSIKHIKSLHTTIDDTSLWYLSRVLAWASDYDWCIAVLLGYDICPTVVNLLMYVTNDIWCSSQILILFTVLPNTSFIKPHLGQLIVLFGCFTTWLPLVGIVADRLFLMPLLMT